MTQALAAKALPVERRHGGELPMLRKRKLVPPGRYGLQKGRAVRALAVAVVFATVSSAFGACSGGESPTAPLISAAASVAQAAAAVTDQPAPMADEATNGKVMGFDTNTYPGDATMQAWIKTPGAPYKWVGFYLPSPCHKDASWSGKRVALGNMGWGFAVVYVGQQTWGRNPTPLPAARIAALLRSGKTCNAGMLTAERGAADAADAANKAAKEGFAKGSVVFLDIERMEVVPVAMRNYYKAWTDGMLADGRYLPGAYVHEHNAQLVHDDIKAEYAAKGVKAEPRFWIAGTKGYDEGKAPQDVGFAFAGIWQGVINTAKAVANVKLPVDVNVASWISPSETGSAPTQ